MYLKIIFVLIIFTTHGVYGFKDGDLYRFTSVPDEHVITVSSSDAVSGANITVEPWQEGSNQKWLAVQAITGSDSYLLLPKRQLWNWNKFVKDTTKDRRDFLPDGTMVMGEDIHSGSMITQQNLDGKKYQQWKSVSVDIGKGKVLIKNLNDDKCLFNPGPQPQDDESFLKKLKHGVQGVIGTRKEKPRPRVHLSTMNCNSSDEKQLWIPSLVVS